MPLTTNRHGGQSSSCGDFKILATKRAGPISCPHWLQRSIRSSTKIAGTEDSRTAIFSMCKAPSGQMRHASHAVHRIGSKMSWRRYWAPPRESAPSGQRSAQAPQSVHRS